jgi:hypothetical protein
MALVYNSLYSINCILSTHILDLGYAASFGYLPNTYVLQLQSLFFSFFLEERSWYTYQGQVLYSIVFTIIVPQPILQDSSKPTSKGLVCFTRSGFHVTDSCLLVHLQSEMDGSNILCLCLSEVEKWFSHHRQLQK